MSDDRFRSAAPAPEPSRLDAQDPRLGDLLGRALLRGEKARVVLLGFPTDVGVRRNGGRAGAAQGPAEVRAWLRRLTPDARAGEAMVELLERTDDWGDLSTSDDLEADQKRLGEAVAAVLGAGGFPIVIGGGHETAYGHFLGYAAQRREVAILNWDAHADVRELKDGLGHSGSPFRQAALHGSGLCHSYRVAGLQPQSVAAAHLRFVEAHGEAVWRDELTSVVMQRLYRANRRRATMVSFDLDAVDQSHAPGVSAPSTGGLEAEVWLEAAYQAGRTPHVTSCDVVELCPPHDRDGQTARLAAKTVYEILRGLSARPKAKPKPRKRR